jgi:hypothetical protein
MEGVGSRLLAGLADILAITRNEGHDEREDTGLQQRADLRRTCRDDATCATFVECDGAASGRRSVGRTSLSNSSSVRGKNIRSYRCVRMCCCM